jgi:shikimate dehydrogenase
MIRLGLTGYPLGHSLSPAIHAAALESCGLEGSYSLFPVQPDDREGLKDLLQRVRNGEITGLNVTIPHKQNVIEFLDELTQAAGAIGAVNTIYMRDGMLIGDNTDAPGFLSDLKRFLTTVPEAQRSGRAGAKPQKHGRLEALVLGAGGSARAVVYALLNDGWRISLCARRAEQARQLADSLAHHREASLWDHLSRSIPVGSLTIYPLSSITTNLQSLIPNLSLLVNTTPLGLTPNIDQSPWPATLPFPPRAAIYDLVYNPRETRLVKDARAQGLPAATGLGMLIEQAALAFKTWTGCDPSREILRAAMEQSPVSNL